jgi:hypothetical protein
VARAATALHSIVFVTKRPGGYDVLLEALARQTNRNYELICVDELADHRAHAVKEMAAELQVNRERERIFTAALLVLYCCFTTYQYAAVESSSDHSV